MNREIKFRGINSKNGQWEYGNYCSVHSVDYIMYAAVQSFEYKMVNSETIGQFTGLLDVDGKEAYYGDIIEHSTTEGGLFKRVISWSEELQSTMIDGFPYYRMHESGYIQPSKLQFRIIGNIHENPELTK